MEILEVIWQAFLYNLTQMPQNLLTPSISLPILTGVIWLATKGRVWKPLVISLIAMGWGGMFYGWAGLVRLTPLFIDALNIANWDWAWVPTIVIHFVELLAGLSLYWLKSRLKK